MMSANLRWMQRLGYFGKVLTRNMALYWEWRCMSAGTEHRRMLPEENCNDN